MLKADLDDEKDTLKCYKKLIVSIPGKLIWFPLVVIIISQIVELFTNKICFLSCHVVIFTRG